MFKTAAVILSLLLFLTLFQSDIKGWVVKHQMDLTISGLDVSADTEESLHDIAARVGRGLADRAFSDIEIETLLELRGELKALKKRGDDVDPRGLEAEAKSLTGRFEAILRRHKL